MKRTAPRSTLRKIIKKHKPQLRLAANADLLVRKERGGRRVCGLESGAGRSAPQRWSRQPPAGLLRAQAGGSACSKQPAVVPSRSGSAVSSRAESSSSMSTLPGSLGS